MKSTELRPDRSDAALTDLTGACRVRRAARGTGCSAFVPHATAGLVDRGAGSRAPTTTCSRRSTTCCPRDGRWRHRHGSPGHGADHVLPLLAPPIAHRPGRRRAAAARDVAVDRAARPEPRQPDPDRSAELRGGLTRTPAPSRRAVSALADGASMGVQRMLRRLATIGARRGRGSQEQQPDRDGNEPADDDQPDRRRRSGLREHVGSRARWRPASR